MGGKEWLRQGEMGGKEWLKQSEMGGKECHKQGDGNGPKMKIDPPPFYMSSRVF